MRALRDELSTRTSAKAAAAKEGYEAEPELDHPPPENAKDLAPVKPPNGNGDNGTGENEDHSDKNDKNGSDSKANQKEGKPQAPMENAEDFNKSGEPVAKKLKSDKDDSPTDKIKLVEKQKHNTS